MNDNDYDNDYNPNYNDNNDNYDCYDNYDYEDTFGFCRNSIDGHNPGLTTNSTLSILDRPVSGSSDQNICFREVFGDCQNGKDCKFSHNFRDLQSEWRKRVDKLRTSKYCDKSYFSSTPPPSNNPPHKSYTPSNPPTILSRSQNLRSLSAGDSFPPNPPSNISEIPITPTSADSSIRFADDVFTPESHLKTPTPDAWPYTR